MFCLNLLLHKFDEWLKGFNQVKSQFLTRIHNHWLLFCLVLLLLTYYGSFLFVSPKYEVYAVRFGNSYGLEKHSFMEGANGRVNIAWSFWLIKRGNTNILVDSGFTELEGIKNWGVREYIKPSAVLSQIGVTPEMVSDVILTTAHWDRAGGIHLFPHAKLWIQKGEYLDSAHLSFQSNNPNYTKDIQSYLNWLKSEGRLKLFDGSFTVKRGIKCYPVGGHTNHSQVVIVDSVDSKVVLGGSDVYFYENIEKDKPIYPAVHPERARHWVKNAIKLVTREEFIVPSYDPLVFELFDNVAPNVVKISEKTRLANYRDLIKGVGRVVLTDDEKLGLIQLARHALGEYTKTQTISITVPENLKKLKIHPDNLFVTLRNNGKLRGCQGVSRYSNIPENLLNALKNATHDKRFESYKHGEFNDLRIELFILFDEYKFKHNDLPNLRRSINLGLDSIQVVNGNKSAIFVCDVAVTHNWSFEYLLYELFRKARLIPDEKKTGNTQEQIKLVEEVLKNEKTRFYKYSTIHLLESEDQKNAIELFRSNILVPVSDVNKQSLMNALKLSTLWLINAMNPDGSKIYIWRPYQGTASASNNLVRQLATASVMVDLAKLLQNSKLKEAAQANLEHHFAKYYKEEREKEIGYIREEDATVNIGTAAFSIMTILKLNGEKKYARELKHLINFILNAQREDGSFKVYYPIESVDPQRAYTSQRFYSGEALLALMYMYEKTQNTNYLEVVKKAFPYHREFYAKDHDPASISWLTQAYYKAYLATKNLEYAEFIFNMTNDLLKRQVLEDVNNPDLVGHFDSGYSWSTGVYLEGIVDAYELAQILNKKDLEDRYKKSIILSLRYILQLQFKGNDMFYVQNKKKVLGGFRSSVYNNEIRIDSLQHCPNGIMKALKVIEDWKI